MGRPMGLLLIYNIDKIWEHNSVDGILKQLRVSTTRARPIPSASKYCKTFSLLFVVVVVVILISGLLVGRI